MKKIHWYKISTLIILVGVFLSCEIEDIKPKASPGNFSASVDGSQFKAVDIEANLFASSADSLLEITATNKDQSILTISVNSLELGTYSSASSVSFKYSKSLGNGVTSSESSSDGSITILSYNDTSKEISGTFNFNTKTYFITNGKFDAIVVK